MNHVRRAACHVRRVGSCILAALMVLAATGCATRAHTAEPLRVCADPNNLPFSNERGEGFENELARMLATNLGAALEYTWWRQGRGFVRHTLDAGQCDVVMGVPAHYDPVLTTRPYYRSTYVFVSRHGEHPGLSSLDDERLRRMKIGVQLIGDDFANSPPAHALSARGMIQNVVGFPVMSDYSKPNPPARIVEAVANRQVDAALVWGPLAGYFASRLPVPLDVTPLGAADDGPARPFAFDIAMAVRRGDNARLRMLDRFIGQHEREIEDLLVRYGVPRVPASHTRGLS